MIVIAFSFFRGQYSIGENIKIWQYTYSNIYVYIYIDKWMEQFLQKPNDNIQYILTL